jgi:hypothetical protein
MPQPGEVFYLPREAREVHDKGDRPHVLLSLHGDVSEVVTLAYGSTRSTDAAGGGGHVLVDPAATSCRGSGLSHPTYVYTSRLVSYAAGALGPSSGRIIGELPAILSSLTRALGLGSGVTAEANVRSSNRRGRIVELAPDLAEDWDVRYAVVVTEPQYSRTGYQQTVVPLLDGACEARDWTSPSIRRGSPPSAWAIGPQSSPHPW